MKIFTPMISVRICAVLLIGLFSIKLFSSEKLVVDDSTGLSVQPGFEVDLLYKVDNSIYGSWISMAFDTKGRLVVSDQGKAGTFLIDIPEIGKTITTKNIKKLPLNSGQWGMLFAFDHLYMVSQVKLFGFQSIKMVNLEKRKNYLIFTVVVNMGPTH